MYIGAVSEEAKEHNVGHEQSNTSDHLYRVGRNVQHNTKFTVHRLSQQHNIKKINKGYVKVFGVFSAHVLYFQAPFLFPAISLNHWQHNALFSW